MITLALGGWRSHGAAAVGSSGRLLAAVDAGTLAGARRAGLWALPDPWMVASRCLAAAGVPWADVGRVRLVADTATIEGGAWYPASASIARRHGLHTDDIAIVSADDSTLAFARRLATSGAVIYAGDLDGWVASESGVSRIARYGDLVAAAERLASALGESGAHHWLALQRLADANVTDARWQARMRPVLRAEHATESDHETDASARRPHLAVSMESLESVLRDAAASVSAPLDRADSPHVGAQAVRAALAAAWLARVSEVLADAAGDDDVRFGGLIGTLPAVARHRLANVLPCPDARAAVVGAAIADDADGRLGEASLPSHPPPVQLQAIGEHFDEAHVKLALESSRLDYLYEPRPERLMDRVSALLASGKLVAWFEGRADLDDVPSGTRVVLADAAERYARDNINVYLRHQPVESLLTVAVTEATAARHFGHRAPGPGQRARLAVPAALLPSVEGAMSRHGLVDLVVVRETEAPGLHRLLIHHEARTGHSALVVVPLATAEGPVAARPIDAIGVSYTTPVDALVMGRFVIFKDYWLLRSGLPTA